MKILLTGAAGFIGMHAALQLLDRGNFVVGLDNLNDYYDVSLKKARLARLSTSGNFTFYKVDVSDRQAIAEVFSQEAPDRVIHLAAQAGVRYSLTHPHDFVDANLLGFMNVVEASRMHSVEHLVYASSSSVYGSNAEMPFSEHDSVDHPISLYAATKKTNELMAHAYSHLFRIPTTGLRFFTVYGPWGRPDMALFLFTRAILEGRPIDIFNNGQMVRDFTYIDDIVTGLLCALDRPATPDPYFDASRPDSANSSAPYRIFNLGNGQPRPLSDYIQALEQALGRTAERNYLPMQPGDVMTTASDMTEFHHWTGFKPGTSIQEGVESFVRWYRDYYRP